MTGRCAVALLASLALTPTGGAAQEVADRTYAVADGSTVLVHTFEISASRAETWRAFTTGEGVMTWAAPFARVDFRLGGIWESSYDPAAKAGDAVNIRNRYSSFIPERMLALQAGDGGP